MRNDPRGSNWRKWDLHVHTPESIINHYPGQKEDAWEAFLKDLENLPPEYSVLGINDYIFLDGYRRVLAEREKGRLPNIAAVFPVVELRIDMFGGNRDEKLKRINYHVIFSDELDPDTIQTQFINGLSKEYYLDGTSKSWSSLPTPASLKKLGKIIYDATPEGDRDKLPSSMEELGFNNLNFNIQNIKTLLANPEFEGLHLKAMGRKEWADFPWNIQYIADKKTLIESVDFVLGASKTVAQYEKSRASLTTNQVNDRLIHASDAHALSTSDKPNKIGDSLTWIKAETTFQGLRHALNRFDQRVFVGETPQKLDSVWDNPTKYIRSIALVKSNAAFDESWFEDVDISFNHGLVVIIGNKGSAKSALTDVIGLLGNSSCEDNDYSFLHKDKFNAKPEVKSKHFRGTMVWEDSNPFDKTLDGKRESRKAELVKYIPQKFFEKVCNEIARGDFARFDEQLESVIFSHVTTENRLGRSSLQEVIEHRTEEIDAATEELVSSLSRMNGEIVALEKLNSADHRAALENSLIAKKSELASHRAKKPVGMVDPATVNSEQLTNTNNQISLRQRKIGQIEIDISEAESQSEKLVLLAANLEKAGNKISLLRTNFATRRTDFDELGLPGVSFDKVATLTIDEKPLDDLSAKTTSEKGAIQKKLNAELDTSLVAQKAKIEAEIQALQATLDEPNKAYQTYLKEVKKWSKKELDILKDKPNDSIEHFEKEIKSLDTLPGKFAALETKRRDISEKIFEQIEKKVNEYKTLYAIVQEFIQNHHLAHEFNLEFDVSIVNNNFHSQFFEFIDQGTSGTFYGKAPGKDQLDQLVEKYDFNSGASALKFAEEIISNLRTDKRDKPSQNRPVTEQLKSGKSVQDLYDLVFGFSYLRPHFVLKMLGKDMNQLSPGEKGTLLLVFYLLIDKGDIPLVIDQPEENLDNETIYKLLVPAIQEAKARRQIIIVTHNPNLAVVCDAEQVIRAHIDKKDKNRVYYECGAIENPMMNIHLLDVLEGTSRAFKIRSETYELR